MKKIIVIASAKNESDIIESYCRYNLAYSDAMLIYESHKSSDDTRAIIQKLIDEGLPIHFEDFEGEEALYYETAKRKLVRLAVEKYGADIVVPIDADEFLYHTDGINPRGALEALQEDIEYHAPWRTFIYDKKPDIALGFMPNNFTHYRNPSMDDPSKYHRHGKVIASKYLIDGRQADIVDGAHFLEYPDGIGSHVKQEICDKLVVAHFPIRSQTQVMRKVIPNWINKWAAAGYRGRRHILDAMQLGVLFNKLKETGEIPEHMLRQLSLEYAMLLDADRSGVVAVTSRGELEKSINEMGKNVVMPGKVDAAFCEEKLNLRYTKYSGDDKVLMKAIIERVDAAVTALETELIDSGKQIHELTRQRDDLSAQRAALSAQCDEMTRQRDQNIQLAAELGQLCENLDNQIAGIYNSTTWRIGHRIAGIFRFFVRR